MENQPLSPDSNEDHEQPAEPIRAQTVATPATAMTQIPPRVILQHSSRSVSKFLALVGWGGLLLCIPIMLGMYASYKDYFDKSQGIHERYHSGNKGRTEDKVAIIDISGAIFGGGYVKKQIDRVREDDKVKAVVLRINSPGGTVTGSDYLYHHLKQLREDRDLPMVVSMGGMAASGGYYVAMAVGDQENSIYAEHATTTGSIGVIIPHYDLSGLLARYDVKNSSIVSHPRKQMLSMTREMTPEDREVLQRYVDESFNRFKDVVREGRPGFRRNPDALDKLATGEIFLAEQAKREGLIDEIGFVEDAIARVVKIAGLDAETVRIIEYRRPPNLLEAVGAMQANTDSLETALLELSVPRAYFMLTTIPGLTSHGS